MQILHDTSIIGSEESLQYQAGVHTRHVRFGRGRREVGIAIQLLGQGMFAWHEQSAKNQNQDREVRQTEGAAREFRNHDVVIPRNLRGFRGRRWSIAARQRDRYVLVPANNSA